MTVEERIGAADRRKMDGNALFKEEKLEEAMQQYAMVTNLCSFNFTLFFFAFFLIILYWNLCLHINFLPCFLYGKSFVFLISGNNV